jgi:hypothetical protein
MVTFTNKYTVELIIYFIAWTISMWNLGPLMLDFISKLQIVCSFRLKHDFFCSKKKVHLEVLTSKYKILKLIDYFNIQNWAHAHDLPIVST